MGSIYNRVDMYDLTHTEHKDKILKAFYQEIFKNKDIHRIHDVSIGSGNLTLPLIDLGFCVSGSDLSQQMLDKCQLKAPDIKLVQSDFREVDQRVHETFDLVMSTGNSLPYVFGDDVLKTLTAMDKLVNEKGYLYIDLRNWDKIVQEKQRFYLYNPFFVDDTRVNITQVWDHHDDDSVTFNILYTFETQNKIYQKEVFEEHYYPIYRAALLSMIKGLGYDIIEVDMFPKLKQIPIDQVDWYFVLAKKR